MIRICYMDSAKSKVVPLETVKNWCVGDLIEGYRVRLITDLYIVLE